MNTCALFLVAIFVVNLGQLLGAQSTSARSIGPLMSQPWTQALGFWPNANERDTSGGAPGQEHERLAKPSRPSLSSSTSKSRDGTDQVTTLTIRHSDGSNSDRYISFPWSWIAQLLQRVQSGGSAHALSNAAVTHRYRRAVLLGLWSDAQTATAKAMAAVSWSRSLADAAGAVTGGAEAYLIVNGGAAAAAAGYGIVLQYASLAAAGLDAALSSALPSGLALLASSGVATVTLATASGSLGATSTAALPPLDGTNSYLQLLIPAPGLNTSRAFGCLVYDPTSSSPLRIASGSLTGLPAVTAASPALPAVPVVTPASSAAPPVASYDSATGQVTCRVTSVAGSYVVAQEAAGGGSGGSTNNTTGSDSNNWSSQDTEALVVAVTVGGVMAVPLTVTLIWVVVARLRRRREEAAAAALQRQQVDSRQSSWFSSVGSRSAVHALKVVA